MGRAGGEGGGRGWKGAMLWVEVVNCSSCLNVRVVFCQALTLENRSSSLPFIGIRNNTVYRCPTGSILHSTQSETETLFLYSYLELYTQLSTESYDIYIYCLLYTSPSPRDISGSRMPSSA